MVLDADADAQLLSDSTSAWVFPTTDFSVVLAREGLLEQVPVSTLLAFLNLIVNYAF